MELKAGYKLTELGALPLAWDTKALGPLVTITSGESPSKFDFNNQGTPYFKVEQLNNSTKYQTETPYLIKSEKRVKKGSLIFPKRGASILLNKIRILVSDSFMDTNLMALTPGEDLHGEYLYYALSHIGLWRVADTTSIPQINNKHINPLVIPIPPEEEQKSIANALSDVDNLLAKLDQLIAKKSDIKKGAMQELLTGKRRLPGFNKPWGGIRLRDIGTTYGGLSGKSKTDFENGKSHYIPFTNVMSNVTIDMNQLDKVSIKPGEVQNTIRIGDLIFNGSSETPEEVGYCSAVTQLTGDLYLNSFCFGFRPREEGKVCPLFLAYYFRGPSGRAIMSSLAQGSTRYNLSKNRLLNVELDLPDLAEQEQISAIFSDMDSEISELKSKRAKMADIKQGMMQQLLTGKIRLV